MVTRAASGGRRAVALVLALVAVGCHRGDDAVPVTGESKLAPPGDAAPVVGPQRRPRLAPGESGPNELRGPGAGRKPGFVGVITAQDESDVSSKLQGELATVDVRLGDSVEAGDLIATIDDRNIREELAIADAAARSARARISQARVEVEEARQQLAIEQRAFAQGSSSKKQVVEAEFRLKKAVASSDRTEADLGEQRARVSQLRRRLDDAKITAPFAGTVSLRHLDPGAIVQPGQPIVRLITSHELWAKFAVPGDAAPGLSVGQTVDVDIESLGVTVEGTIRQIAPELEPSSQMIIVEAELQIPAELDGRVQSGLVARVKVKKKRAEGAPPATPPAE